MNNSIVLSLVLITGSLALYWNSRKGDVPAPIAQVQTTEQAAPETKTGKKNKKQKTEEVKAPEVVTLDQDALKKVFPGYWVSKNSVPLGNGSRKIQMLFNQIQNPDLHDGKVIEATIFSFDEKNPSIQSLGKVVFDSINGDTVKFRVEKKDVSNYYADAYVYEEDNIKEILVTAGDTLSVSAMNDYKEKIFSVTLSKLNPSEILSNYKGKWRGVRKSDNENIFLNFGSLKDFHEDFGAFKVSGTCFTDSKFKIRPVDEKVVLISVGNASCGSSTMVYKSVIGESELETVAYRQYDEAYEMRFKKD